MNIEAAFDGSLMQMLKVIRVFKYTARLKAGLSRKLKVEFDVWKHGEDEKNCERWPQCTTLGP